MVSFEHGPTESTHDSFPRFPVKRNIAEPSGGLHIGDACSAAAPRTKPCCWLAPPHLTSLVHQKTKANHFFFFFSLIN